MLTLKVRTAKGEETIKVPNCFEELTVDQFQKLVSDWDGKDWITAFSILSGQEYSSIAESRDYSLEGTLYAAIHFLFTQNDFDFESLPFPEYLEVSGQTIKVADKKKIGRFSIGQTIQVRKALEGVKDHRVGISKAVAIYLQPYIDARKPNIAQRIFNLKQEELAPFNNDRAMEIEKAILKMPIVKVFPVGFFLLKKLQGSGDWLLDVWHRILPRTARIDKKERRWQKSKGLNPLQT